MGSTTTAPIAEQTPPTERISRILARGWFREMRDRGFSREQILSMAVELIEMAADDPTYAPTSH